MESFESLHLPTVCMTAAILSHLPAEISRVVQIETLAHRRYMRLVLIDRKTLTHLRYIHLILFKVQALAHLRHLLFIHLLFVRSFCRLRVIAIVSLVLAKLHQHVRWHVQRTQLVWFELLKLLAELIILSQHIGIHPKQFILNHYRLLWLLLALTQ